MGSACPECNNFDPQDDSPVTCPRHSRCDACGKPGKIQYDSNGEGTYWLCERTDGDHDESHYCGTEVARTEGGCADAKLD